MPRDAQRTREKLITAAAAEFAASGLAGARIDRIAAAAGANKNLIYIYFGSKEGLFQAVAVDGIQRLLDAVPFTADDLPGYVGRLFDFNMANPQLVRLVRWASLERPEAVTGLAIGRESTADKLKAIAGAQSAGAIDPSLPPADLLVILLAIASAWADGSPEPAAARRSARAVKSARASAVLAARRLVELP